MSHGPTPKSWISAIHAYVPGKSACADGRPLIKLSANENPLGTSALALAARAQAAEPSRYPDPDSKDLRAAIGAIHRIDPARIVMGTGSDELLNLAAQGYAGVGDEVLFPRFSFSVYDIAARRCGAEPVVAPDADYGTDVDALLALVNEKTRVVFVANPNNPTGSFLPKGEIARLHAALPADVLLVLDQAYGEYVSPEDDDGGLELAARLGRSLGRKGPEATARLGIAHVPEGRGTFAELTVAENLLLNAQPTGGLGWIRWAALNRCRRSSISGAAYEACNESSRVRPMIATNSRSMTRAGVCGSPATVTADGSPPHRSSTICVASSRPGTIKFGSTPRSNR